MAMVDEPKSPESLGGSGYGRNNSTDTLSPSHSVESTGSNRSGTPSGNRLSDRIRHRLDRRSTTPRTGNGGPPPLSPRGSNASNNNNNNSHESLRLQHTQSHSSSKTPISKNTTVGGGSSTVQPGSKKQRSRVNDRVKSLLLTREGSEEEESTIKKKVSAVLSPTSTIDSLKTTMEAHINSITSGIIANISDADRSLRSTSSDSDDDDDDDDDDSSHSGSSSHSGIRSSHSESDESSSEGSDSLLSVSGERGRSFSPIYEGTTDIISPTNTQPMDTPGTNRRTGEINNVEPESANTRRTGVLNNIMEPESREPPEDTKLDRKKPPALSPSSEQEHKPRSFSFCKPSSNTTTLVSPSSVNINIKDNSAAPPPPKEKSVVSPTAAPPKEKPVVSPTAAPPEKPVVSPTAAPPEEKPVVSPTAAPPKEKPVVSAAPPKEKPVVETNNTVVKNVTPSKADDGSMPQAMIASPSGATAKGSSRHRIPGGAAAKLMLLGPPKSDDDESSSDDDADKCTIRSSPSAESEQLESKTLDEISSTLFKAKHEFSTGGEQNRRYHHPTIHEGQEKSTGRGLGINTHHVSSEGRSSSNLPSSTLFNRSEVFHQDASAAVAALLTPRIHNIADGASVVSGGAPSETQSVGYSSASPSAVSSAFQTPRAAAYPGDPNANTSTFESLSRRDVSLKLITGETEKKLEKLKETMRDPNKTLADLLTAIHTHEDFDADVGFTVRRKNACGALQVMTAQVENRIPIAWTVGVLPALVSVLRDTGEGVHTTYPDKRHRVEFEAARNRAIACLMNLSMPPKNRIAIFHTPALVHWLLVIIDEGHGLSRKGACAILAYLGKTPENRLLMVQVPGLLDALTKVLKPRPPRVERIKVVSTEDPNKTKTGDESVNEKDAKQGMLAISSSFSNESAATPRLNGSHSPIEIQGYDETADELLRAARQNVFALLLHLVKEKDNAYHFARHDGLMATLSTIANHHESPSHLLSVKVLASTTRHKLNTKTLVFKQRGVVPALVNGTRAPNDSTRLFSCYGLQNLAQDKSCRQELAVAKDLISALCDRCRRAKAEEERLAAISAIKNLCDEPANLIPMTNTPDCIATLMHLAHGMEDGISELMQYRACDALATLSHWLRKIATSGQAVENAKAKKPPPKTQFVPSLQVVPFLQWT